MAPKSFNLEGIGSVTVYKRRGSKRINLRIAGDKVRITQPMWLPYASGFLFAKNNTGWITQQLGKQQALVLKNGMIIGKYHHLQFKQAPKARTTVKNGVITVCTPYDLYSPQTQATAKKGIKRALKTEASKELPKRVDALAKANGFKYENLSFKSMRSRWGSCNNKKSITLSTYLMMLPSELVDYVIVHELAHTKHLNHSKDFWDKIEQIMPDYKTRRSQLKTVQHLITPIQ